MEFERSFKSSYQLFTTIHFVLACHPLPQGHTELPQMNFYSPGPILVMGVRFHVSLLPFCALAIP